MRHVRFALGRGGGALASVSGDADVAGTIRATGCVTGAAGETGEQQPILALAALATSEVAAP